MIISSNFGIFHFLTLFTKKNFFSLSFIFKKKNVYTSLIKVYEKFFALTTISILQIKCVILAHTLHGVCNKLRGSNDVYYERLLSKSNFFARRFPVIA